MKNNEFQEIEETLGLSQSSAQKASFTSPLRTTVDQRDALLTNLNELLSQKLRIDENVLYT